MFGDQSGRKWQAFLGVFLLAAFGLAAAVQAQVDTRPIIVFREDDCRTTWRIPFPDFGGLNALEYGKLRHIPITWGIITGLADGSQALTWAEIKDYLDAAGGEAASHSVRHAAMPSIQDYIDELVNSKAAINSHLGPQYSCKTFLQPGTWTGDANMDVFAKLDNAIGQALQTNYDQSLAYLGGGWHVGETHYTYGLSNTYTLDHTPSVSMDSALSTLNVAAATPGIVFIVACHGVQASGGTNAYEVRADVLKAFMDRLAELRDAGIVRLLTIGEAYQAQATTGLNCIPNGDFDLCGAGSSQSATPWTFSNDSGVIESIGIDQSRCGHIGAYYSKAIAPWLQLPPGRYELEWYQRRDPSYPSPLPLMIEASNYSNPYATTVRKLSYYPLYSCSSSDMWEHKRALMKVSEKLVNVSLAFMTGVSGGYLVDNVSMRLVPVDPNSCPSRVCVYPNPMGGIVSWDTPNDPTVQGISCRYSTTTHPTTLAEGLELGYCVAQPGSRQQMSFTMNWDNQSLYAAYISVFGTGTNGQSGPEVECVVVDRTPPTLSSPHLVFGGDGTLTASWTALDNDSSIYQHRYAVGTAPGTCDVLDWTHTTDAVVTLNDLPTNQTLYFSAQSQNCFGLWSDVQSVPFRETRSIADACACQDGTRVTVRGTVSAAFNGFYYVTSADRARGIRILSEADGAEGAEVQVTGTLTTTYDGERGVRVD